MTRHYQARDLLDRLIAKAQWERYSKSIDTRLPGFVARGEPIPEEWLPGRLVMRLAESEREVLRDLTADELQVRVEYVDYGGPR